MSAVRKATTADVPQLAEALARAFQEDPVFKWVIPRDAPRLRYARRYFAARARHLLTQDEVYTTDDRTAGALWARPGEWRDPPLTAIRQIISLVPALGTRLPRALTGLREVEARHPPRPHWYLSVLGTEPRRQGEGLGSALLQPVLADCDRLEVGAYLETATERNVSFYGRHGFDVVDEVQLPGGPLMWLMWRDPR